MYDKGEEDLPYPGYNHINFQDFSENYLIMDFKVAADDHSSGRGQSPFYQSTNLPHSFVLTNNCQDKRNERPFPMHSPESSKQSLDLMKDPPGKEPAGE